MKRRFVLVVFADVETDYAKYAYVELDDVQRGIVLQRHTALEVARIGNEELVEERYRNRWCRFYDDVRGRILPVLVTVLDEDKILELTEDHDFDDQGDVRTDYDQMILTEEGVAWMAGIKHQAFEAVTKRIDIARLR